MLEKLQKVARAFAENRFPLSGSEISKLTGYGYFDACSYCEKLIRMGIIDVAQRSECNTRVVTAVFAPELTGENLDEVVSFFFEQDQEISALKERVRALESFVQSIKGTSTKLLAANG